MLAPKCWLLWEIHRMCVVIVVIVVAGTIAMYCIHSFFSPLCSSRAILLLFNKTDSPVRFGNSGVPNLYACIESSHTPIFYCNNNNEMAINFGR